jgi:arginase family enzyme
MRMFPDNDALFDRKYPDACVIWIDAHADINTAESTESGVYFHSLSPMSG